MQILPEVKPKQRGRAVTRTRHVVTKLDEESVYRARIAGALLDRGRRFRLIDLFAGAGGMTVGFTESLGHRFKPVWANDFNEHAAATYNRNFGKHCLPGDIVALLEAPETEIPEADVVIGGPPCQGFSLLNKNRDGDPRKQLWRPFLDVVERSGAQVFVMENVPQLLGSFEHGEIAERAHEMGFMLAHDKLLAADYGVPQTRWRAFIVGCRFADPKLVFAPKRTHFRRPDGAPSRSIFEWNVRDKARGRGYLSDATPWRTVMDAIGDLPKPEGTEVRPSGEPLDLHFGRTPTSKSIARYKAIPKEGMNRFDLERRARHLVPKCWIKKRSGGTDLFGRLWWDRPAFTIRTEFFKPEKGRYLHPEQHRPITHREAARFQSFPDSFKFEGPKIEIAKQIGNAVPPVLAARIADSVYSLLLAKKE